MTPLRRLFVGEQVLVSRAEDGENHEEATVVDYYELLMEGEKRPMVVVDFADGVRAWVTAAEPNVMTIDPEEDVEDEELEPGDGEGGAGELDEGTAESGAEDGVDAGEPGDDEADDDREGGE